MSEDSFVDGDAEAAMRAMMGFASFSTRRPREQAQAIQYVDRLKAPRSLQSPPHAEQMGAPPQANSTFSTHDTDSRDSFETLYSQPQPPAQSQAEAQLGDNNDGQPPYPQPALDEAASVLGMPPTPSERSYSTHGTSYAFSAPNSNTFYTRAELDEWARGKVNARGDVVYFKPAFVSDDPWARLRPSRGQD
ncbi:hypothetical protein HRR85_006152 [Exophiala dermatitidis]|nr:hypothetical protein HRR85_006152 [Exophiala dermatitidis]